MNCTAHKRGPPEPHNRAKREAAPWEITIKMPDHRHFQRFRASPPSSGIETLRFTGLQP